MPGKSKEIIIIKNFKRCLQKYFKDIFFIFVGGGKVARNYQKAFSEFGAKDIEKDRIGINVKDPNIFPEAAGILSEQPSINYGERRNQENN